MKRLVLSQEGFERGGNDLAHDLHMIKTANTMFRLGYDQHLIAAIPAAKEASVNLSHPQLPSLWDIHFFAASRQLPDEVWDQVYGEDRLRGDPDWIEKYRSYGFLEIADIMAEYAALIDAFEFEIVRDENGNPEYVEVANKADLETKREVLYQRLAELVVRAGLDNPDRVHQAITELLEIDLVSTDVFHRHWIEHITKSPGFAWYKAPRRDNDSWYLPNEPYGWLTVRHGAALEKHGFSYKFAFWHQEIGRSSGHLWIQTDRGPLRLTDATDTTCLESVFPVQVATVFGEPLFELQEADVPRHLMSTAPDIPKDLAKGVFALKVDVPKL